MNLDFQVQEPFDERGHSPASQRYQQARHLMDDGQFEKAAELFLQSTTETPRFKAYELLGECYIHLKQLNKAIPYLAAATTLNRGVGAPSLLAEVWLALGKNTEAVEIADIALSRDSKNKTALRVKQTAVKNIKL